MRFLKEWSLMIIIAIICIFLFLSGWIFDFTAPCQIVIKKTFLVVWWYFLSYIFRRLRLGRLKWDERDKKIYYYILLIGASIIIAFS